MSTTTESHSPSHPHPHPPAHAHGAGHAHAEPNYVGIWGALAMLTAFEIGVTFFDNRPFVIASLVGFALAKAALVAAYFMHLKFEKWVLVAIVLTPLVLSAIMGVALMPDALTHVRAN